MAIEDLIQFIEESPSPWHACRSMRDRLLNADFTPLIEGETWQLEAGKGYFIERGGALAAFRTPKKKPKLMKILGAHTDSPSLKIKPEPEVRQGDMISLLVDVYGGPILASWLNRDLGIAGQVVVQDGDKTPERDLVYIKDAAVTIPALAIHMDREVNKQGLTLDRQKHLNPLVCLAQGEKDPFSYLERMISKQVPLDRILSFDLFLVPIEPPRRIGMEGEMLASYRIDNLSSCHSALLGLINSKAANETLQMCFFWNHEEVGSQSTEGAGSPFFNDTFQRICNHLNISSEEIFQLKSSSLCVSVDMAHAHHPNYPEKSDPNHQDPMGKGIQIKHSVPLRYATTAISSAHIIAKCRELRLPYQLGVNRSDIPSGSTIGSIFASAVGIETVDIGAPMLSMHSARELMAVKDHIDMCLLLKGILEE